MPAGRRQAASLSIHDFRTGYRQAAGRRHGDGGARRVQPAYPHLVESDADRLLQPLITRAASHPKTAIDPAVARSHAPAALNAQPTRTGRIRPGRDNFSSSTMAVRPATHITLMTP